MPEKPETLNTIQDCFYARWFTGEERSYLKKNNPDAGDEVANLRTFAGRLARHLSQKDPGEYSDEDLKLLTQLVRISVGIGTLLRASASRQGKDNRVEKSIEEALQSLEEEWSLA